MALAIHSAYTSREAAAELGVTDAYVRQLCLEHDGIGTKHGHVWLLTEADLLKIRNIRTFGTGPRFRKSQKAR